VLDVEDLAQRFGGRTVLEIAAWTVAPGRHSLVLGPSGCGKSPLVHLIAGLLRPSRGRILVAGRDLDSLRPAELDRCRGRRIGIVLQNLHLVSAISVRDNLRLARSLAGLPAPSAGTCWATLRSGRDDRAAPDHVPHRLPPGGQALDGQPAKS